MKLTKLELTNFRGFGQEKIELHPQLTLFIGINGAGKTTCLDSLAILLSNIITYVFKRVLGSQIHNSDVGKDSNECSISATTESPVMTWTRIKSKTGNRTGILNQSFVDFIDNLESNIKESSGAINIPLFAYYP